MLGGEIPARTTERIIMADEEAKVTTPEVEAPVAETEEKFAKSGKKSKKHIEEVKAEEERQARKAARAEAEAEAEAAERI